MVTIVAAQKTKRRARAIEIDPLYVDVAVRRWQNLTGKDATLLATGETFVDVERRRR
jgi:DNA modification methylase